MLFLVAISLDLYADLSGFEVHSHRGYSVRIQSCAAPISRLTMSVKAMICNRLLVMNL